MEEFKKFLKALAIALAILLTIIASVGAINSGGLYAFAGVVNFGWLFFPIREIIKHLNARKESGFISRGGISESGEDNKAEHIDINKTDKI